MGSLYAVLTSQILLICLGTTITLVLADRSCPDGCVCKDQVLECSNVSNSSTWMEFVKTLPHGTKSLTVTDLVLPCMTLPDNSTFATFPDMTYLRITHCNISVVGSKAFRLFPKLVELHLDSDAIQEIDAKALHSLSSLKLLNLTQNVITRIHENTFQEAHHLQVLDMAYNSIDLLHRRVFENTEQLKVLNITENNVNYIHPATFSKLRALHTLDLSHNQLELLHPDTFRNLSSLRQIWVHGNPWVCDCGMEWLHSDINQTYPLLPGLKTGVQCSSPIEHSSRYLDTISPSNLTCVSPQITNRLDDRVFLRMDKGLLECNATGSPRPSVYWITPLGILAVPRNEMWMSPKAVHFKNSYDHISVPHYQKSNLVALEDGSLVIHRIRPYLAGEYTCVAENPAGVSFSSFNVTIKTTFHSNMEASMVVGAMTAMSFLLLSIIYASIRTGVYHLLKKRHMKKNPVLEEEDMESASPLKGSPYSEYTYERTHRYWSPQYVSPYESPMKCTTPIDMDLDDGQQQRTNIRETLEDVRFRLRIGMERSVTKIRSGAHHVSESSRQYIHSMRESSNHYMQNIRESGSHTIHNLRSTGSQAANKMRAGVVLSVEQVKYHVQSMKELCLTGSIGQTISTISVATDVDSQQRTDVIKKITFV